MPNSSPDAAAGILGSSGVDDLLRNATTITVDVESVNTNCLQATKKRVFVHIGPPKTGTTSLQDYFACNTETLAKFDTIFLGKINPKDVKQCSDVPIDFDRPMVQYRSGKAAYKLRREVMKYTSQNKTVILSDEDYINTPVAVLENFLVNIAAQVIPVVVYRRYHEWLLSLYNFKFMPKWYERNWKKWEGHSLDNIPTFRSFAAQREGMHPTLKLMNDFSSIVEKATGSPPCTQVLNLHDGEILKEFAALIVGRNNSNSFPAPVRSNVNKAPPFSVDMERLALKLYMEGRVNATIIPRRDFVSKLHSHVKWLYLNRNSTPPLDCYSPDEEKSLLEKTIHAESLIVPKFFSDNGKAPLEVGFQKLSENKAFCNVDLDEMLREGGDAWAQLLNDTQPKS